MKKYLSLIILTIIFGWISAKQVESNTAKVVAENFLTKRIKSVSLRNIQTLDLVYTISSKATNSAVNYFYVFNLNGNQGFIIVSADDNAVPILGYSDEKGFDPNNISPSCAKYLEKYKSEIRQYISDIGPANDNTNSEWSDLINGTEKVSNLKSLNSVSPLLSTTWNQNPFYNDQCPYDAASSSHCVTGCVACAMAQIMKYWSYPQQGSGFNTYNDSNYGTLSANFGATTYHWSNMPNSISADNTYIETLMNQCGVGVDMNYGVNESSAWVISADNPVCAQTAFVNYFGYNSTTIRGLYRRDYSDADWITILENEISSSRPVQYAGFGSGGHTWVCDGYDANGLFHMNWGWGGLDNGYFSLDALNPQVNGINRNYSSGEEALIGIEPTPASNENIQLYSSISVTPNPVQFRQTYTVAANVINGGSSNYNGEFCAALFNSSGIFIKYIGNNLQTNGPLQSNQYDVLSFSDLSMAAVIPGNYTIGIYYLPSGANNWILAGTSSYTNLISVNFDGPFDSLALYAPAITPTPTTFTQGQSARVNFGVWNVYSSPFDGTLEACLLNLTGDTIYQVLGTYYATGQYAMPANSVCVSPYITVSAAAVNVSPGTYLLGITYKRTGSNYTYYVGGSFEPNPTYINVVAAPLLSDIYEPDNTLATAHVFPVNFSGNTATVSTTGSNCHIGTDYDYYEIKLLPGYDYTIASVLDNSVRSLNGHSYSLDAAVSYSIDSGNTWSDAFDGGVIPNFMIHGGGVVYFWVSPYFLGQIGTYLLNMTITKAVCTVTSSITPSGTYYICQGSSLNLSATSGSGYTYQWQLNGTNITENGTSQSYAATQSGNYTVMVTSSGCSSISNNELTLNLRSGPTAELSAPSTAGFTPLTVNFSDNSLNTPTQWEWMFPGGTPSTSNSQNPTVTYNGSGLFDVSLKAINGCGSDSMTKVNYVNVLSTGIQDNSFLKSMSVFPNPTDGNFSLIAELNNAPKIKISIFNPIGQMVYSNETDGLSSSINMTFDLSNYATGIYLLKLSAGGSLICTKILIQ